MNVPAIAKKSFDEFKSSTEIVSIVQLVLTHLKSLTNFKSRVRFIHEAVDDFNVEVFSNPLVKTYSPCKIGCSGCCHTQVSVTEDEAEILYLRIQEGVSVDLERLKKQFKAKNDSDSYYKVGFEERRCVFLDEEGACRVYNDRPSVCRTNAVIGSSDQCDTKTSVRPTRLVRTPKSDMVIYASFLFSKTSGTLPYMLGKRMGLKE